MPASRRLPPVNEARGVVSAAEWERRLLAMHGATETEAFIGAVFRLLEGTVRADFSLANLRNVDGVPLIAWDSLGREFDKAYMERFFKANPSVPYVMRKPGLKLLPTRGHLPAEPELQKSVFYREFMEPESWRHSVALLFWGGFPPLPQHAFCVFRSDKDEDFSDDDLARLLALHPHIATALERLKSQLKDRSTCGAFTEVLRHLPVGMTLLDWDLAIVEQNEASRRLWLRWIEGEAGNGAVPADIRRASDQLRRDWKDAMSRGSEALPPIRWNHARRPNLEATVTLAHEPGSLLSHPQFVVHLHDANPEASLQQANVDLLSKLTPPEREAVLLAAQGLGNQEIAEQIFRSVPAVKQRLHKAFKKLEVRSRAQLVSLLRGIGWFDVRKPR